MWNRYVFAAHGTKSVARESLLPLTALRMAYTQRALLYLAGGTDEGQAFFMLRGAPKGHDSFVANLHLRRFVLWSLPVISGAQRGRTMMAISFKGAHFP